MCICLCGRRSIANLKKKKKKKILRDFSACYVCWSHEHSTEWRVIQEVEVSLLVWCVHHRTIAVIMSIPYSHSSERLSLYAVYCTLDLKYGMQCLYKLKLLYSGNLSMYIYGKVNLPKQLLPVRYI